MTNKIKMKKSRYRNELRQCKSILKSIHSSNMDLLLDLIAPMFELDYNRETYAIENQENLDKLNASTAKELRLARQITLATKTKSARIRNKVTKRATNIIILGK